MARERKNIDPVLEVDSTKSTKQAKPQGGAAFCCPATPATSSAISRFLFEGGISFRVPLSSLRSGWRQNDRHSLASTDLCLNYFPLRSPRSREVRMSESSFRAFRLFSRLKMKSLEFNLKAVDEFSFLVTIRV